MLLNDLVSVIETMQQRIRDHGPALRENETRTRMGLIDPLLAALGWDVSDPALVIPEYNEGAGRADYALLGSEGIPVAVVEAERLGQGLSYYARMQVLKCAEDLGVRYAAWTNGDDWELHEVFKPAGQEDRLPLRLRVTNAPLLEIAMKMVLFWRYNLLSERPAWPAFPELVTELDWVSLAGFDPAKRSEPPTSIRFPDGAVCPVAYWKELPVRIAKWLYKQRYLTAGDLPIFAGIRRVVANSEPVLSNGSPMEDFESIGNGDIFVRIHEESGKSVENAKKLLRYCGVSLHDVYVCYSDPGPLLLRTPFE